MSIRVFRVEEFKGHSKAIAMLQILATNLIPNFATAMIQNFQLQVSTTKCTLLQNGKEVRSFATC